MIKFTHSLSFCQQIWLPNQRDQYLGKLEFRVNINKDLQFGSFNHTQVGVNNFFKRPVQRDATSTCPSFRGCVTEQVTEPFGNTVPFIHTHSVHVYLRKRRWLGASAVSHRAVTDGIKHTVTQTQCYAFTSATLYSVSYRPVRNCTSADGFYSNPHEHFPELASH